MPALKPWREIAITHEDVLKGTFKQAEFAADLSLVHDGAATPGRRRMHLRQALTRPDRAAKTEARCPRRLGKGRRTIWTGFSRRNRRPSRKMREQMLASTSSIFDQVRKNSSALDARLSSFDRLSRMATTPSVIETRRFEFANHMAESSIPSSIGNERRA
jgi:hypothetical protein